MGKVSSYTERSSLNSEDLIYTVRPSLGTAGAGKVTAQTLRGYNTATAPVRLVVPYYGYLSFNGADQTTIINNPAYGAVVIVNVNIGPGASVNTDFQHEIARMDAGGVIVVGYVDTSYATRTLSAVKADIDSWYTFYRSSGLKGIFFDLTPTGATGDLKSYMRDIAGYVHAKGPAHTVIFNPGTYPLEVDGYFDPADIVCVWEADWSSGAYLSMTVPGWASGWVDGASPSKMLHLVYNVTTANDMRLAMAHANSVGARCFYATSGGSLWTTLASHYATQATVANTTPVGLDPTDRREHHGPVPVSAIDGLRGVQTVAYAATVTPNPSLGRTVKMTFGAGNVTIAAPSGEPEPGDQLRFILTQDATGGRTTTWNAVFKAAAFSPNTGANKINTASFEFDGVSWILMATTAGL